MTNIQYPISKGTAASGELVVEDVLFGHAVLDEGFDGGVDHAGGAAEVGLVLGGVGEMAGDDGGDEAAFAGPAGVLGLLGESGNEMEPGAFLFELLEFVGYFKKAGLFMKTGAKLPEGGEGNSTAPEFPIKTRYTLNLS